VIPLNTVPAAPPAAPPSGGGACSGGGGPWCEAIYRITGAAWLARPASLVADGALHTLVIIVVAVLVRGLAHRAIRRIAAGVGQGHAPAPPGPPRDRGPHGWHGPRHFGPGLSERRRQRAATIGSLLRSISTFVIYGTAFVLILGEFGVNLAPIIASAGVIGVAVGFGAQNLIKDFLSGIFMMIEDQYGVGDVVDLGQAVGTVESIGLRVSTVRDIEGTLWYVRNGAISRVGNLSQHFSIALVDVPFGHGAAIGQVIELAERAARAAVAQAPLSGLLMGDVQVLGVQQVRAEGLTLRVTVKTRPGEQVPVRRALFEAIATAFTEQAVPPPALPAVLGPAA